jgi:putative hydrolase of the HAD superfamily
MSDAAAVEAVLFDLDDTLHDDTQTYRRAAERVAREVALERGVSAEALMRSFVEQSDAFWVRLTASSLGTRLVSLRERMWNAALVAEGIDEPGLAQRCAHDYNVYRRDFLELWPGAIELLVALRARGCKLAMITNGFAETHREKIAILQLEDAFDEIFIADEVGMLKPDPRLFRLAAERLAVPPERCAMVGDRFERDVWGGHAAGMFTVWMNVRDERVPLGGPQPDAIVTSILEVEGVLPLARKR